MEGKLNSSIMGSREERVNMFMDMEGGNFLDVGQRKGG